MDWFAPLRRTAWGPPLADTLAAPELAGLAAWLDAESAAGHEVLPEPAHCFRAFELVAPGDVRAVILGQDPYPTPGHAHGLAFSYAGAGALPRSLRNVLAEWSADLERPVPSGAGDLTAWARSGVLLLNTVLSVRAGEAGSHRRKGWEVLTAAVLDLVCTQPDPVVFLLWGNDAKRHAPRIRAPHHVLASGHPSPLSIRYFRGTRPFSRANALLGSRALSWDLDESPSNLA